MKYIITRIDYNHIKAEVDGYYPLRGTFEGFFKDLRSYINRYAFVRNVEYKNHTIFMEKLDSEFGFLYTDEYVLDGLLENDARFMEYMESFLAGYKEVEETLKDNVASKMAMKNKRAKALNIAVHLYEKYCADSEIEVIEDKEIARDVVQLFRNENPLVYTGVSCSMEGDTYTYPRYKFATEEIKRLRVAVGVSGVATAGLAISALAFSNPITAIAGVATGVGCYCANKKKKDANNEEAKRTMAELAQIYGKMYPDVDSDKDSGHKLIKKLDLF